MGAPPTNPGDTGDPLDYAAVPPPQPRRITLPEHLGPYRVTGEIAQGGMARVVRARHTVQQTTVALKVIPVFPGDAESAELVARLTREAHAAAEASDHPNIVRVHEVGVAPAAPGAPADAPAFCYIAMELVDGPSLDERLARGPLPHVDAARLLARVARAVGHAHRRGFVHRDIKPANILLDAGGVPHLADFGLTRSHDGGPRLRTLTQSGTVLGTPSYMPPEQARGERVDARADVYALGATLYECVAGVPPFRGLAVFDIVEQVLQREPRPLAAVAEAPAALGEITAKAMAKLRGQRYPTAEAMAEDLDRFVDGLAVLARRGRWRRRAGSLVFRRPALVTFIAGGPVISLLVAAGFWFARPIPDVETARYRAAHAALSDAQRTTALAGAFHRLMRESGDAMRVLEDGWHGVPIAAPARQAALRRVESAVAAGTPVPAALGESWLGLARFYVDDEAAGLAALRHHARAAPGDDPVPSLLLAHAHFARFARRAVMPAVAAGSAGTAVTPQLLTDTELHDLDVAAAAITRARRSPAWATLRLCRIYERLDDAAALLRGGRYEAAANQLGPIRDDPVAGSVAQLMSTVAFLNGARFAAAARAAEPLAQRGWEVGLRRLCTAWAAVAAQHHDAGASPDAALDRVAAVADRYVEAYPQSPDAWLARARAWAQQFALRQARGNAGGDGWERALADIGKAVELAPARLRLREMRAGLLSRAATAGALQHQDPMPYLEQGIADCSSIVAARPGASRALAIRASLHRRMASWLAGRQRDAGPALDRALADAEAALAVDRSPTNLLLTARVHQERATWAMRRGVSPVEPAREAMAHYREAFRAVPATPGMYRNRATVRMYLLWHADPGRDENRRTAAAAIADFSAALESLPDDAGLLESRGLAREFLAAGDRQRQADVRPALRLAVQDFGAALAVDGTRVSTRLSRCGAIRDLAAADRVRGIRTAVDLDRALTDIHTLLKEHPALEHLDGLHVDLHAERAFVRRGRPEAREDWNAAERACRQWIQRSPGVTEPRARLAAVLVTLGRWTEAGAVYAWLMQAEPANTRWPELRKRCRAHAGGR